MAHAHNELFAEGHRQDWIRPSSRTSVEANTGWLSMRDYHKAVFLISVGTIAANGTFDAQILQATDENGAGVKAITGKQITALGDTDDNADITIELDASELDVDNKFDCILGSVSCGGAAAILCTAVMLRYQPRFKPVDYTNLTEVVE
jgi:hypothetical protein